MRFTTARALILALGLAVAAPAPAQFSDSYVFLKAVRDRDGDKATKFVREPGSQTINTRDYATGEGGLHIVVKRRDMTWLGFLLGNGAKADLRDNQGDTPLAVASRIGFDEGVQLLLQVGADANSANNSGETPLILAVQARELPTVRLLLASGADPRKVDHIAGMSAHDYAARDSRSGAILKLLDEAKPVKPKAQISGPKL